VVRWFDDPVTSLVASIRELEKRVGAFATLLRAIVCKARITRALCSFAVLGAYAVTRTVFVAPVRFAMGFFVAGAIFLMAESFVALTAVAAEVFAMTHTLLSLLIAHIGTDRVA